MKGAGYQDGASAPTRHPSSPRPYVKGICYPMVGGTITSSSLDFVDN